MAQRSATTRRRHRVPEWEGQSTNGIVTEAPVGFGTGQRHSIECWLRHCSVSARRRRQPDRDAAKPMPGIDAPPETCQRTSFRHDVVKKLGLFAKT